MIWQTVSTSSADTERIGELLGRLLESPALIELRSDLGGGKTTFVRGLVRGFGSKDAVSSPTFTLNKVYKNRQGQQIHHFDFYRLDEPGVLADQLAESLHNPKVVTAVEWSDIVKDILPPERMVIGLSPTAADPDERQLSITYPPAATGIIKQIEAAWAENRP